MNYFHEYLDEQFAELLRAEVAKLVNWGDSEFTDDIVEHLPGRSAKIVAKSLVSSVLSSETSRLIEVLASHAAGRLCFKVNCFTSEALRYEAGVGLAIHNDFDHENAGYPGGRVIVQLSDRALLGGELELYRELPDKVFEPILTCETGRSHLIGFVVSEDSFHAVQPIESGRRLSIVLNLWSSDANVPPALLGRLWNNPLTRSQGL
jgi:hypothetical protein